MPDDVLISGDYPELIRVAGELIVEARVRPTHIFAALILYGTCVDRFSTGLDRNVRILVGQPIVVICEVCLNQLHLAVHGGTRT